MRSARLCAKELEGKLGRDVALSGWVSFVRRARDITFVGLKDTSSIALGEQHSNSSNVVQIVIPNEQADGVKLEDVVSVHGVLEQRPSSGGATNTGGFEIKPSKFTIENRCQHPLPLDPKALLLQQQNQTPQQRDASLKYRYLDLRLRAQQLQRNLQIRAIAALAMRNVLSGEQGFLEVETPTLFKSTPEGAREFLVPVAAANADHAQSSSPPKFYALVQSPQQYKQMLMVGGIDRYFQFARCYRDEGGRADRQPEFTQLDMEMAFVSECAHVQVQVERVVTAGWRAAHDKFPASVPPPPPPPPSTTSTADRPQYFEMQLEQALREYGSDKPNLSFGMPLEEGGGGRVTAPGLASALSKRDKSDLIRQITTACAVRVDDISFDSTDVRVSNGDRAKLGRARLVLREWMLKRDVPVPRGVLPAHQPFWVVDFNLFEVDEATGEVSSTHHPFTAPHVDDLGKLDSLLDKLREDRDGAATTIKHELPKLRALHYDLVCDGVELGGGSIRIHNSLLQERVLRHALGISQDDCRAKFGHLLDALALGAPPHGGFALGFDRFVSLLCGAGSLSDTLAFPKSSTGTDPLTGAPCALTASQSDVLPRFALQPLHAPPTAEKL